MKLYGCLFISLTTLLAACASDKAQIPQEWPSTEKAQNNGCINLTGVYVNKAIEAPTNVDRASHERDGGWAIYLSKLLVPYIPSRVFVEHKWADRTELKGVEKDTLEITMWKKNEQIYHTILKKKRDFKCTSQHLVLSDTRDTSTSLNLSVTWEKTKISRGIDGSLLVTSSVAAKGLAFNIIPASQTTVQHYRFMQVKSSK